MRKKLIGMMARADQTQDMNTRWDLYTKILETPKKHEHLTVKEIADVYYNRSLTHIEICGFHFSRGEYREAIQSTRSADSDIKNAEIKYDRKVDKEVCQARMIEYRNTRWHIIGVKEGKVDASMSQFSKVSRTVIMNSDALPIYNTASLDSYIDDNEAIDMRESQLAAHLSFAPLPKIGFFEISEALQLPAMGAITNQRFGIGLPVEDRAASAFFRKTDKLKRKLEITGFHVNQEEKKLNMQN